MRANRQAKSYKSDLQYADNDIPHQFAQIETMIAKKEKVLVIAAIDGTTSSNALQKAAAAGIQNAIAAGIAYVTEDRKSLGLVLSDDIKTNIPSPTCPASPTSA